MALKIKDSQGNIHKVPNMAEVNGRITTRIATKQDTLVSGTNIKTINTKPIIGSGDIELQTPLVSGTDYVTPTQLSTKEPVISSGTSTEYWRGDKTWQEFPSIPNAANDGVLNIQTTATTNPIYSAETELITMDSSNNVNLTLHNVARTGDYADLLNAPTISELITTNTYAGGDLSGTYPDPQLKSITTAKTYGLTTTQSPAMGSTFSIPYVTIDAKGRVTTGGTANVELPDVQAPVYGTLTMKIDGDNVSPTFTANSNSTINLTGVKNRPRLDDIQWDSSGVITISFSDAIANLTRIYIHKIDGTNIDGNISGTGGTGGMSTSGVLLTIAISTNLIFTPTTDKDITNSDWVVSIR